MILQHNMLTLEDYLMETQTLSEMLMDQGLITVNKDGIILIYIEYVYHQL